MTFKKTFPTKPKNAKTKNSRRAGNCSVDVAWRGLELTVEHVPLAGRSDDDDANKDNDGDMDDLWYYRSSNKKLLWKLQNTPGEATL